MGVNLEGYFHLEGNPFILDYFHPEGNPLSWNISTWKEHPFHPQRNPFILEYSHPEGNPFYPGIFHQEGNHLYPGKFPSGRKTPLSWNLSMAIFLNLHCPPSLDFMLFTMQSTVTVQISRISWFQTELN